MISGFRSEVAETCALLGYYAANSGNFLPTFRDNFRSHLEGFKNPVSCTLRLVPIGCPETSGRNYRYSLRNNPQQRRSLLQAVTSLKNFSHIIYNKSTRCNSGSIVFINNYKYALHVLDALCVHLQEHYKL